MKQASLFLALATSLTLSLGAQAQHTSHDHDHWGCVVEIPKNRALRKQLKAIARPDLEQAEPTIHNSGYHYVYRLAICITPRTYSDYFHADKNRIHQWWDEMEKRLNALYTRDVGVRFEVIRDDKLILTEVHPRDTEATYQNHRNGSVVISRAIGVENYEVGIMIGPPKPGVAGIATLGGVTSATLKGSAYAEPNFETIAHELGHMFGAEHTHTKYDANFTEPGQGQSVMSYGAPCDFFALSSVRAIRATLSRQSYYLDATRSADRRSQANNLSDDNMPYVEAAPGTTPRIVTTALAKEYVVPEGTYFQLRVPVEATTSSQLFWAHPFDLGSPNRHNYMQPAYRATASNTIQFQHRYREGYENGRKVLLDLTYSNDFRPGAYTYMLAASDQARFDTYLTKVRIVPGETFKLVNTDLSTSASWGRKFYLQWQPSTAIYGTGSKVRILLSADFGQSYPYVLADDVPNTGRWEGYLPYVLIGQIKHPDYNYGHFNGGVIKIEVKGEAAYCVTTTQPYYLQYNGNTWSTSSFGFSLSEHPTRHITFRRPDRKPLEPFVSVANVSDIPAPHPLEAIHSRYTYMVKTVQPAADVHEGRIVRRTWTVNIEGLESTYTQIFQLPDTPTEAETIVLQTRATAEAAHELYRNEGQPGYPLPSLTAYTDFKRAYEAVYDREGKVLDTATPALVSALASKIIALGHIDEGDIVLPEVGRYYTISSYQKHYGREQDWYLTQGSDYASFTDDATQATSWLCKREGDKYVFVDEHSRSFKLPSFTEYTNKINLERGYTWGAYTLVNANNVSLQLHQDGVTISTNTDYRDNRLGYRVNGDQYVLSTDFKLRLDNSHTSDPTKIGETQVVITSAGYATLVLNKPWRVPQGVAGAIVTDATTTAGGYKLIYDYRYAAGSIVPAGVPVLLQGTPATYTIELLSANTTPAPETNFLRGNALQSETASHSDFRYYIFTDAPTADGRAGFYYQVPDGTSVTSDAQRAYLAIPTSLAASQATGFNLDDTITAIRSVTDVAPTAAVYDLQGRAVPRITVSGFYLIDGVTTWVVAP